MLIDSEGLTVRCCAGKIWCYQDGDVVSREEFKIALKREVRNCELLLSGFESFEPINKKAKEGERCKR